jgi:hypothetical protein
MGQGYFLLYFLSILAYFAGEFQRIFVSAVGAKRAEKEIALFMDVRARARAFNDISREFGRAATRGEATATRFEMDWQGHVGWGD